MSWDDDKTATIQLPLEPNKATQDKKKNSPVILSAPCITFYLTHHSSLILLPTK